MVVLVVLVFVLVWFVFLLILSFVARVGVVNFLRSAVSLVVDS